MIEKEKYDYWKEESTISDIVRDSWDNIRELKKVIVPKNIDQEKYDLGVKKLDDLEKVIDNLKEDCDALNEIASESESDLEELKYELESGIADYVIGNYNELKKRMEIAGLWQDKMDFFFENLIRYSNKV